MTPTSAPARLHPDERRAQLIELGRTLFNARPYDDISVDDIASAAGVSKGLLYHYFPSKRSFYVETVRRGAEEMTALTSLSEEAPPLERLQQGLDAYIDNVEANASSYTTLLRSGIGCDPEVAAIVEHTRHAFIERILSGMGVTDPPAPLRIAMRAWIGFVEGASLEWLDHGGVSKSALRTMLVSALNSAVVSAGNVQATPSAPRATAKRTQTSKGPRDSVRRPLARR